MGFFDDVVKQAAGAAAGAVGAELPITDPTQAGVAKGVLELATEGGGIGSLVQALTAGGLGQAVSSWIGTGPNAPVSAAQITQALGNPMIQQLAAKVGLSPEALGPILAQVIPILIDKLTPNGKVPEGDALNQGMGVLKGLLGG